LEGSAGIVHHVARRAEWRVAAGDGYRPRSLVEEGFIHCSTAEQLTGTIAAHFTPGDDLVVLTIDVARLAHELRWEPSRDGDLFPHLYGPLDTDAVVGARPWRWQEEATATEPPEGGSGRQGADVLPRAGVP
jgi:uncharacterized protein (DUF952 family)